MKFFPINNNYLLLIGPFTINNNDNNLPLLKLATAKNAIYR